MIRTHNLHSDSNSGLKANKNYKQGQQAILRDGVSYDDNADGTIQNNEKEPIHTLRLVR